MDHRAQNARKVSQETKQQSYQKLLCCIFLCRLICIFDNQYLVVLTNALW